jgi:hypothetical protein
MPNTIRLDVEGNEYKDAIFVRFTEGASEEYDGEYDVKKIFGLEEAPQFYSIISGELLSINSLPELTEYEMVMLGFECGIAGSFTIEASEIASFEGNISIYLEDLSEDIFHNLSEESTYTFSHVPGGNINRFLLHFGEPNAVEELIQQDFKIYSHEDIVYVQNPSGIEADILVYNVMGQEISRASTNRCELVNLKISNGTGNYIVFVKNSELFITEKVFINR